MRAAGGLLLLAALAVAGGPHLKIPQEALTLSSPTVAAPATDLHAGLIGPATDLHVGLIGPATSQNVWALFGGEGYTYNNHAVRAQYWPRLYGLALPNQLFEARAASGPPEAIVPEGSFYTATVLLRPDLKWTDGASFTAKDVAFTVNTALQFKLGFDWGDFYDGDRLDHAEAVAPDRVKFFFKSPPGIAAWQYGALQGPVVQEAFWATRAASAAELLPGSEADANIEELKVRIANLEDDIYDLYVALYVAQGAQVRPLQTDLRRQQDDLNEANNDLDEAQAELQAALHEARAALFAQDDSGEPLLGRWLPDRARSGTGVGTTIVNLANPAYPGPRPSFERVIYRTYPTREAAQRAQADGQINLILDPLAEPPDQPDGSMLSPSSRLRLLHFNLESPLLSDVTLRRALACMLDQTEMAGEIPAAAALSSVIAPQEGLWYETRALLPCAGLPAEARLSEAVNMLKARGYTWEREPSPSGPGQGLKGTDGVALPPIKLLAPGSDEARLAAAMYAEERAQMLGLPVSAQPVSQATLDFAVFSSRDFDMAILGWQVGAFPGYACDWFSAQGAFGNVPAAVTAVCGELKATSDLEEARGLLAELENSLANEVPVIPLYSVVVADPLRGISYPFASVLNGLSGVYGAPELAFPAAP